MNTNELRQGCYFGIMNRNNEVHLPYNFMCKAIEIHVDKVLYCDPIENPANKASWSEIAASDIIGIPLTDNLFKNLGFEMSNTGFIEKGRLLYHKEYGWKILENWVKGWVGVSEPKYVHQLQNLYYSITGEELMLVNKI